MTADLDALLDTLPPHLEERVRVLQGGPLREGAFVLYWMRTAVRGHENPALDVALELARRLGVPAFVYHAVSERYRYASDRIHRFLLEGARDVSAELARRGVGYALHVERPGHRGPHLGTLAERSCLLVTEDMPTPMLAPWTRAIATAAGTGVLAVDTACVVPMNLVPQPFDRAYRFRQATEAAREARLLRPWPEVEPPTEAFVPELPFEPVDPETADLPALVASCVIDHTVGPVPDTPGGSRAGYARWRAFEKHRLRSYHRRRNDAADDGVSRMSAYLHFGHVSPLRLARDAASAGGKGAEKYLDELLVWREMAYRWCRDHAEADQLEALPSWARATLRRHASDPRPQLVPPEDLARGRTGHRLWDLAQRSLLAHGELHNNLRMTWGKAMLSWTPTPDEALARLLELNHRFALDGRDPASYGGLLWCLGGFDRPFEPERPILGTVRPRSLDSHARRLDLDAYEAHVRRPRRLAPPRVAVVGAGVAGLTCARTLVDHGLDVVVLDKGRGAGGRLSTRRRDGRRWDHGASGFEARTGMLRRHVQSWEQAGVVAPWSGRLVRWTPDGLVPEAARERRWVGVPGMNAVLKHLGRDVDVRYGARVTGIRRDAGAWCLDGEGDEVLATADVVVLAAPAPQAAALCPSEEVRARLEQVAYTPELVALLAWEPGLRLEADRVRVEDDVVASLERQGHRPGRDGQDAWVVHATRAWSERHVDEAHDGIGAALAEHVARRLLDVDPPAVVMGHRWRYGRVEVALGTPCLVDREAGVVACGDGCLGDRVEHAFLSGAAAAGRILGERLPRR